MEKTFLGSFLTPGTGAKVLPILNVSLVLLLCVLVGSAVRWSESTVVFHLGAMSILATILLALVNWFAAELKKQS